MGYELASHISRWSMGIVLSLGLSATMAVADSSWDRYLEADCPALVDNKSFSESDRSELITVAVARLEVAGLAQSFTAPFVGTPLPQIVQIEDPQAEARDYRCALRIVSQGGTASADTVTRLMSLSSGTGSEVLSVERQGQVAGALVELFQMLRSKNHISSEIVDAVLDHGSRTLGDMLLLEAGAPELLVAARESETADGTTRRLGLIKRLLHIMPERRQRVIDDLLKIMPTRYELILDIGWEYMGSLTLPPQFIQYLYSNLGSDNGRALAVLRGLYKAGKKLSRQELEQGIKAGTTLQRCNAFALLIESSPLADASLTNFLTFIRSNEPELVLSALSVASKIGFRREVVVELVRLIERLPTLTFDPLSALLEAFEEMRLYDKDTLLIPSVWARHMATIDEVMLRFMGRQSGPFLKLLEKLSEHADPLHRERAAWILDQLRTNNPLRVRLLVRLLNDSSPVVRQSAAKTLSGLELSPAIYGQIVKISFPEVVPILLSTRLPSLAGRSALTAALADCSCASLAQLLSPPLSIPDTSQRTMVRQALFSACRREARLDEPALRALESVGAEGIDDAFLSRVQDMKLQDMLVVRQEIQVNATEWTRRILIERLKSGALPLEEVSAQLLGDKALQQAALEASERGPISERLRALELYLSIAGSTDKALSRLVEILRKGRIKVDSSLTLARIQELCRVLLSDEDRRVVVGALGLLAIPARPMSSDILTALYAIAQRDDLELRMLVGQVLIRADSPEPQALPILEEFVWRKALEAEAELVASARVIDSLSRSESLVVRAKIWSLQRKADS